jgi:tetratricopeptide (TPR) repeat protein
VGIDRAAVLRNAEKLLKQGKVESAIAEYVRVVEDQPKDWTTANTLGDLYLRVKLTDKAIEQFARIADNLHKEGFLPKAAAVYKKILKIRPDDEHALLQSGDIAAKQGVLVDARTSWSAVAQQRLARGDKKGAAEIQVRLGSLDPTDLDARREAARARLETGDTAGALRDLQAIADDLGEKGQQKEAIEILGEAASISPDDQKIRGQLFAIQMKLGDLDGARAHARTPDHFRAIGEAYLASGLMDKAAEFLTSVGAAGDSRLVLKIADSKFRVGQADAGLAILKNLLQQDPPSATEITRFSWDLARSSPDNGYRVLELTTDAAVREGDWPQAAAGLQEFVRQIPNYVPALLRLVEVCVDGGLESTLYNAQAQLVDAYLATGAPAEARVIAEDLVAREPDEGVHVERLHRALSMLGPEPRSTPAASPVAQPVEPVREARVTPREPAPPVKSPPAAEVPPAPAASSRHVRKQVAERSREAEYAIDDVDLDDLAGLELRTSGLDLDSLLSAQEEGSDAPVFEPPEVDLSIMLDEPIVVDEASPASGPAQTVDLEEVFEYFRSASATGSGTSTGEREYERAVSLRDAGRFDESVQAFQTASRSPRQRFRAAASLGRMYRDHSALRDAIEWFERAAEAPAPSLDEAHALFYELAEALEACGETARALAVCLELQADAGEYRDVTVRINRLSRAQTRG